MTKITLNNLANLQNETSAVNIINDNNDAIEIAFENTLSRDGTFPNQMSSNLDMNSNRILNLPAPRNPNEPLRLKDINTPPLSPSNSFKQEGEGAVNRTWLSKVQEEFSVTDFGATGNGVDDDSDAIQAAVDAAGDRGKIIWPKGTYLITKTINVPYSFHIWEGDGKGASIILYVPSEDGTAVAVGNGSSSVWYTSFSKLSLFSTDVTHTKIGFDLLDVRGCYFDQFSIGGADSGIGGTDSFGGGSGSIGVRTRGREFILFSDSISIAAEKPIVISQNPNNFTDFDHSEIFGLLVADGYPCITVDDGVYLSNSSFGGSWNGGTHSFYFNSTTDDLASHSIKFKNLRSEQGQNASSYSIYISPVNNFQNLSLDNVQLDTTKKGIYLRKILNADLNSINYGSTSLEALNIDNTVINIIGVNCFWNTGSTASVTGLNTIFAGPSAVSGSPLPSVFYYANRTPDFNADVLSTGRNGGAQGRIDLYGSTSGVISLKPQVTSGTYNWNFPQSAGSAGQPLLSGGLAGQSWGTLSAGAGGTGQTSYTVGDLLYASTSSALNRLNSGASGTVLRSTGLATAPSWGKVDVTTDLSAAVPVASGGTGATTSQAAMAALKGVYVLSTSAVPSTTLTGSTSETVLATIPVPANAMGANGRLEIEAVWGFSSGGAPGTRTVRHRLGGNSIHTQVCSNSTQTYSLEAGIFNRNSASSQVCRNTATAGGWGSSSSAVQTFTIDTTTSQNITLTCQLADVGDSAILHSYCVKLIVP